MTATQVTPMVTSRPTSSCAATRCPATPADGGLAWRCCTTVGWPRGCVSTTTLPPRRLPAPPQVSTGRWRSGAPRSWSGCSPRWRFTQPAEGEPW
jgi:hypothetical protein